MGTGYGKGDNRSVEAAQEAISSPLLDNVSIEGAAGVLINITGGMDLTIDEVTTIASIIQEAAGDEAEIIFGAVHDPNLEGEVRVTVIATGLVTAEDVPAVDHVLRGPNFSPRPGLERTYAPSVAHRRPAAAMVQPEPSRTARARAGSYG